MPFDNNYELLQKLLIFEDTWKNEQRNWLSSFLVIFVCLALILVWYQTISYSFINNNKIHKGSKYLDIIHLFKIQYSIIIQLWGKVIRSSKCNACWLLFFGKSSESFKDDSSESFYHIVTLWKSLNQAF